MKLQVIILTLFIIVSCNSISKDKQSVTSLSDLTITSDSSLATEEPARKIINFIKWYRHNMERLNKIELLDNAYNVTFDSTKFYSVNFKNTETYLNELKRSNSISDNYLSLKREYFQKCDKYFKENPQNEGPPFGFDIDLVLYSQEYEEDLANINKSKISVIETNDRQVKLKLTFYTGNKLVFVLSKYGNSWLIDKIESGWKE